MRKKSVINSFFLLILLSLISIGCGFKGNPSPYQAAKTEKPVIDELETICAEDAILLKWKLQDKSGIIGSVGIERSELGTSGNECRNCPRTYTRVGNVVVEIEENVKNTRKYMNFTDKNVEKGKTYDYRLMLCEKNGSCYEAATREVIFK